MLNDSQKEKYSRQIMLSELGVEGQEKLQASSILICGVGGLGSPAALYLAAMGIGRIGLIDGDRVTLSNLNRQILYSEAEIGQAKVSIAKKRLLEIAPEIDIATYEQKLDQENAKSIIAEYDLVLDCLDNMAARFIVNDACVQLKKPFVHAGISHLYGQIMTIIPQQTPCLRCLFPDMDRMPEEEEVKGILGAVAGAVGSMQAIAAYKYLLAINERHHGLVIFDSAHYKMEQFDIEPASDCFCQKTGK